MNFASYRKSVLAWNTAKLLWNIVYWFLFWVTSKESYFLICVSRNKIRRAIYNWFFYLKRTRKRELVFAVLSQGVRLVSLCTNDLFWKEDFSLREILGWMGCVQMEWYIQQTSFLHLICLYINMHKHQVWDNGSNNWE